MNTLATGLGIVGACSIAFLAGRASNTLCPAQPAPSALIPAALTQPETPAPLPDDLQAMMEANKPGPQHELIARMNGSWRSVMTGVTPDGGEMRTEGTMDAEPLFDGRFVGQHFSGEFMGMPFEGLGVYGYSTMTGEFQYCWFDSFGTHLYYATGEASADGKTLTFRGLEPDPAGGDPVKYRDEIHFASDTQYTMKRFYTPEGGEFEGFSIVFTKD